MCVEGVIPDVTAAPVRSREQESCGAIALMPFDARRALMDGDFTKVSEVDEGWLDGILLRAVGPELDSPGQAKRGPGLTVQWILKACRAVTPTREELRPYQALK